MKRNLFKLLFLAIFATISLPLAAQTTSSQDKPISKMPKQQKQQRLQQQKKEQPKVSTEFGLGVGARYNWFDVQPLCSNFTPKLSMQWSGGAALQFRLNIGRSFGFQPEISYARSVIKINDETNGFSTKAKSNIVQIPMLLSFRAAMFRFNFGPVFTLMDEATYQLARADDESIQQMHLGKIYTAVTYAAGISVKFAKVMMIDVRYADQFVNAKSENQYLWSLDENKQKEAQTFRTRTRSVQLRFGVVF